MNLAARLRPNSLDDFVGQEDLVGNGKIIRKMIESDSLFSMILWGPPGSGKTTLARIISNETQSDFYELSAVSTGKSDLDKVIEKAKENQRHSGPSVLSSGSKDLSRIRSKKDSGVVPSGTPQNDTNKRTILFIDEIHRWNKAQQDRLLPHVEAGLITLIGATTENPSFEVISPLLSRSRVFVLKSLEVNHLKKIISDALKILKKEGYTKKLTKDAEELLIRLSGGDARIMLNALEIAVSQSSSSHHSGMRSASRISPTKGGSWTSQDDKIIDVELIKEVFQTRSAGLYDKKADEHYNIISAFIKSMRGSSVDGALYYLARMLENGEDPKFIARRMIIFASEDIGLADRGALIQANAGFEAIQKIGMPEAQLILAHIVIYLASAKKSRAVVNALGRAKQAVYDLPNEPIPLHLRNAPTKLMKGLGYGKDYKWSEKYVGPRDDRSFLPEKLKNRKFFEE